MSADSEFAVWSATLSESDVAPITLAGPLGHVNPGDEIVCTGTFTRHPKYG
jgi:hypothetical protein